MFTPRKSLNKAFLKLRLNRLDIEKFKTNLKRLLSKIDEIESEENQKNHVRDFLRDTYYAEKFEINTKDRNDLVIHNGKDSKTSVGVILEAKRPNNKAEMLTKENINAKAFQELVLYFLRERIKNNNKEIKYLVATNIYEWFIFDTQDFEKIFANNKEFVKQFTDFDEKRLSGTKTEFFYKEIAEPFITNHKNIPFTYFDIRDYKEALENNDPKDDVTLIVLFKLLSPEHLLKLPFLNDSNSLDKSFYSELLHIIGLEETKDGSKKIIQRKKSGERNSASLIENAINELDSLDKIHRIENSSGYGNTYEEKLFSVAIELVITWVNRILFLKLLEAQQIKYHRGDENFAYLNNKKIKGFDDLNTLFFQVLSKKGSDRNEDNKKNFALVPYLNSSLFEISTLEDRCFTISQLKDNDLPIFAGTVLKENTGKKRTGQLGVLEYFFKFLEAFDFSSEGSEDIQEENKTLINASVLGLIFEKINGYKDGSFFTPGFITTYMCKETIRRAVIQKFNESKGWNCKDFNDLYNKMDCIDLKEANQIVGNLKVCDPAVGSGHFLVSALNEIIAIKSELGILADRTGKKLRDYSIEVENDELIVSDRDDGILFEYNPKDKESQCIQEALFHEKQTIIENCLFGVDINQNSVNICRLRLWIELLKNAYYIVGTGSDLSIQDAELQTLPNIDINIKKGNSLISKHPLDSDIKVILKKRKWSIEDYKNAVHSYQNAKDKSEKREMDVLIHSMKTEFIVDLNETHPDQVALRKVNDKLATQSMFKLTKKEIDELEKAKKEKVRLETKLEEMRNNKIYQNSFEWRFEFPEVLNQDGDFVGFDVVIGNPPYILIQDINNQYLFDYYKDNYIAATYKIDTYHLFYELGFSILKSAGMISFISPNTFLKNKYARNLRELILNNKIIKIVNFYTQVFEDASVDTLISMFQKETPRVENVFDYLTYTENNNNFDTIPKIYHKQINFIKNEYQFELDIDDSATFIFNKLNYETVLLKEIGRAYFGIQTFDRKRFVSSKQLTEQYRPIIDGTNVKRYYYESPIEFVLFKKEAIKSGGDESVYKKDRIVVRQIGIYPEGAIVPPNVMTLNTIYNIFLFENIEMKYPLTFILGIINSKLIQYFWKRRFYDNKSTFPKIKKAPLESIPIKKYGSDTSRRLSETVTKIIEAKKKDPSADTGIWEKEMDEMVYRLYQLTYDEVMMVDPNFNKSRKEYEESAK